MLISDLNVELMRVWQDIIERPTELANAYARLWHEQLGRERAYYDLVRDKFNATGDPACFLYLLARCVKGAVRYNSAGEFNQSPDNRRKGARPETMARHIMGAHNLLAGVTSGHSRDYRDVIAQASSKDFIYMDPPYQGVSGNRDARYIRGLGYDEFCSALEWMNDQGLSYALSYDGRRAEKAYGRPLPPSLELARYEIDAGRSTQATLLGRSERTYEALLISPALAARIGPPTMVRCEQPAMF